MPVTVFLGRWSASSGSIAEGNSGTTTLDIPVFFTRFTSAPGAVSVHWATSNGTATGGATCTAGVDY